MSLLENRRATIIVVCTLLAIAVVSGGVWWLSSSHDDTKPPLASMHIEVGGANDPRYCADFVANEVGRDQIKITITNCGNATIAIKHGHARTKVAVDGKYSTTLPPGVNSFHATATSLKGEFLGSFTL